MRTGSAARLLSFVRPPASSRRPDDSSLKEVDQICISSATLPAMKNGTVEVNRKINQITQRSLYIYIYMECLAIWSTKFLLAHCKKCAGSAPELEALRQQIPYSRSLEVS